VLDLNFPLLSDWNGEAVRGFGVELPDYRGMKGVAERTAFLIDEHGTVRRTWRYGTDELPDADELLATAKSLSD
jgi:peroxiredoxin